MTTIIIPGGGNTIKSIQRGTVYVANGFQSGTATIAAVDVNKSIVNCTGSYSSGTGVSVADNVVLTNSTTVTATWGLSSHSGFWVSFEVIEFN